MEGQPLQRISYELYRDKAAFDAHGETPHTRRYLAERDRYLASTEVDWLTLQVGSGRTARCWSRRAFRLVFVFMPARHYDRAEETARTAADALSGDPGRLGLAQLSQRSRTRLERRRHQLIRLRLVGVGQGADGGLQVGDQAAEQVGRC